ncbi:hypothetical protein B9Z65_1884 [Elsinoe australis]|uniref:PQ loop repeat protein n=1 Tax=Elsinoe australis TaxID=40998 RepID=A0A2P7YL48_9PEZI|nr:hypothetical protein B9Z65_1884 [Elsinoe australis]
MAPLQWLITHIAPLFLVTSPITSYADQIYSIHRTHSSAGFSLDIPLIMLVASILKIFYWYGERYDTSLLLQAVLMVGVQTLLLHVALLNRPSLTSSSARPFDGMDRPEPMFSRRPYHFWQWRPIRPYWNFLAYYTAGLLLLEVFIGDTKSYIALQGYVALSIEAMLPIPQIASNQRNRSCKGFRLSVLLNWLVGDAMKMSFFFLAESDIPWAFKLCGLFQALCDCFLGVQYWMYGEGQDVQYSPENKEMRTM